MARLSLLAWLTLRQCGHQTRNWVSPSLLLALFGYAIWSGDVTLPGLYRSAPVMLLLPAVSLVVSVALIAGEVESGRVLLLRPLGVTPLDFVLGRAMGAASFCLLSVLPFALLVSGFLIATGSTVWLATLWILVGLILYYAYLVALLAFLSTVVRSWGNAAVALGMQFAFLLLVVPLFARAGSTDAISFHMLRLLCIGPLGVIVRGSESKIPPLFDVLFSLLIAALLLLAAVYRYRNWEIGKIAGRT